MRDAGVISNYALFGATAQIRYTEPLATLDADVLVTLPRRLYEFCEAGGYPIEGEAIRVGAWPVQFIPVFNTLTGEAVEQAETADFDGVPLRVVGAAHLAVIAPRILALLESGSVTTEEIAALASRHGLEDAWICFKRRFVDVDE